jgi:hypothetical protein
MFRHLACASLLVVVLATGAWAGELRGRFQYINTDKMTLTVRVDGKDVTRPVAPDARFYDSRGFEIRGGLKAAQEVYKEGEEMVLTIEKKQGGDHIVEAKAGK